MSIPLLIEPIDIEGCIGAAKVVQLLCDDGTDASRAERLQLLMQTASDGCAGSLMPGFSPGELVALVRRDAYLRRQVAWFAIGMAAEGRSEFQTADGKFLFQAPFDRAVKELRDVGERHLRSIAEKQNGTPNRLLGIRTGDRKRRPYKMVFADVGDSGNNDGISWIPGSGGF